MNPRRNRWTGQPHRHDRERARRARQHRNLMLRDLAFAAMARHQVEHLFPEMDEASMARKLGLLRERLNEKATSGA